MSVLLPSMPADRREFSLIVADSRPSALALQQTLARLGVQNPDDLVVSLEQASQAVPGHEDVLQRVFVMLSSDAGRGLKAVRQVRDLVSVPVFAVGPRDAGLILDAIHAGASDYIEDADPVDEPLAKALSRHQVSGPVSEGEGRLICVASARGGGGGSFVSVNLAAAIAQRKTRVGLCDFDLQGGVCDALLNLKPKHTIHDLGRCLDQLDRNSVEMALTAHASGVHLLPAPPGPLDHQIPKSELCQTVLRTIRQMFPIVVADFPRLTSDFDVQPLLSKCDQLIVVTQLDFNSVRSTRRVLDQLDRSGFPSQRIHIVWNRYGQPNELSASKGELALNRKIAHLIPDDPKAVNRSINCGTPCVLESPGGRIAKAIDSLADALLGESGPAPSCAATKAETAVRLPITTSNGLQHWGHALMNWFAREEFSQ